MYLPILSAGSVSAQGSLKSPVPLMLMPATLKQYFLAEESPASTYSVARRIFSCAFFHSSVPDSFTSRMYPITSAPPSSTGRDQARLILSACVSVIRGIEGGAGTPVRLSEHLLVFK